MPIKHKSNYYQKKRCHASASDPHLRGFILQDTFPSPTRRANGAHGKGAHRLVRPLVWVGLARMAPEIMSG